MRFISSFWRSEFWDGSYVFRKYVDHWYRPYTIHFGLQQHDYERRSAVSDKYQTYGNLSIVFYNCLVARLNTILQVPSYITSPYFADIRPTAGRVSDDNQHERSRNPHGRFSPGYEASVWLREQGRVRTHRRTLKTHLQRYVEIEFLSSLYMYNGTSN